MSIAGELVLPARRRRAPGGPCRTARRCSRTARLRRCSSPRADVAAPPTGGSRIVRARWASSWSSQAVVCGSVVMREACAAGTDTRLPAGDRLWTAARACGREPRTSDLDVDSKPRASCAGHRRFAGGHPAPRQPDEDVRGSRRALASCLLRPADRLGARHRRRGGGPGPTSSASLPRRAAGLVALSPHRGPTRSVDQPDGRAWLHGRLRTTRTETDDEQPPDGQGSTSAAAHRDARRLDDHGAGAHYTATLRFDVPATAFAGLPCSPWAPSTTSSAASPSGSGAGQPSARPAAPWLAACPRASPAPARPGWCAPRRPGRPAAPAAPAAAPPTGRRRPGGAPRWSR